MYLEGPAFYDDDTVFTEYMTHRRWVDNPNDTLEYPVMVELVGDLAGRRILDLGCGDASWGREALAKGCRSYLGVEGSHNMVEAARKQLEGTSGEVAHARIEAWDYPREAFDLVVSRLALHYLQDVEAIFARVRHSLVPAGRFVFSVEHPVITSCDRGWQSGQRQAWLVDDYFETGKRETAWLGGHVVKYHRTVEDYFGGLQRAGFVVESLRESRPERRWFQDEATFERRRRIPLFLFLAAAKRAAP